MVSSIEINNYSTFGFKEITDQLAIYFTAVLPKSKKKKGKEAKTQITFVDNIIFSNSAQKSVFDFLDQFIRSEVSKLVFDLSKDEAIEYSESLAPYMKILEEFQNEILLEQKDFENAEEFFAYNSAMALIKSIFNLYDDILIKADEETEEYLRILRSAINADMEANKRKIKINSVDEFLHSL